MIIERLKQIVEYKGISVRAFALKIGVSSQVFGKYLKDREPSFDTLSKIIETFDDISAEWLLTGEGEMLKKSGEKLDNSSKDPTFIPNSFSGLTDEQIEKAMEDAMLKKLLAMYESGLIYSSAAVKEYQQREVELMNENMKLHLEVERLHQLDKQQASTQSPEQKAKPTR